MITRTRGRPGFTLVEMLTALVLLGIIGVSFIKVITSQSQFAERQMALRNARTVSRNALNIMLTDLRMVQDNGGLISAARDSVTTRVPVAFGLLCSTVGGATLSLVPIDSAMLGLAMYGGWAYRDSASGIYSYKDAGTPTNSMSLPVGTSTLCTDSVTGPGILPVTWGARSTRVVTLTDAPSGTPNPGWPAFTYQVVTYRFAPSTAYPGRVGLFRRVKTANPSAPISDEIVAPFDSATTKFRFYVLNADVAQDAPPVDLTTVRGLEVALAGSSPRMSQDNRIAMQALVTGVFFKNRRDP